MFIKLSNLLFVREDSEKKRTALSLLCETYSPTLLFLL